LAGITIAGLMMGLIFTLEWALGWLHIDGFAWQMQSTQVVLQGLLSVSFLFFLVGWQEELLFRGYQLQNIADGLNLAWGVILSSIIFSLAHLSNPGASSTSVLGILAAGIFLAFGYLRSKKLWLPIGLHIGWNFFEGVVFGFPVSGLDIYKLTQISVTGPRLITGGDFGPEAGLVLLPGLALGIFLVYGYAKLIE